MKIVIEESKNSRGSLFYKKSYFQESNGELMLCLVVDLKVVTLKGENGKSIFILYSSKRESITSVYRFINSELEDSSPNTVQIYIRALKILHSYMELFSVDLKKFTNNQWKAYIDFLYGVELRGEIELKNLTKRSADTINIYLSIYRKYVDYLEVKDSPILTKVDKGFTKGQKGLLAHTKKEKVTSYKLNQKVIKNIEVPKYIKIEEFKKVIGHVRKHYSLREEIILRLMFENGLRIGEVLGITLEDIQTTPEELNFKDETDLGRINLINRVSDKDYQLAKNVHIPKSLDEYDSKYYRDKYISYVTPTISLINLIDKYVETVHGELSTKNRQNYFSKASADFINETQNDFISKNYYVFLNKNGTPLSKSGWSKILRRIFEELGFINDFKKRQHNLSHRFRHGYAMYLVKYKNYNELQLKEALRHKTLSSVLVYFNPTSEEIYLVNKEAAENLYSIVPELGEDFMYE